MFCQILHYSNENVTNIGDTIQPKARSNVACHQAVKKGLTVCDTFRSRLEVSKVVDLPWPGELTEPGRACAVDTVGGSVWCIVGVEWKPVWFAPMGRGNRM